MVRYLILFFITILLFSCGSRIALPSTKEDKLIGKVKSIHFHTFDAREKDGQYLKLKELKGQFSGTQFLEYNRKGYKIHYDNFDNIKEDYFYNNKGLLVVKIEHYQNNDIKNKTNYGYKILHDSIEVTKSDSLSGQKKYFIKFDKDKNLIKDGETFEFDSHHNLIKEKSDVIEIFREYDSAGNLIKAHYVGKYIDFIRTFIYTDYDRKGNWTRQLEFKDGVIQFISEREITYY